MLVGKHGDSLTFRAQLASCPSSAFHPSPLVLKRFLPLAGCFCTHCSLYLECSSFPSRPVRSSLSILPNVTPSRMALPFDPRARSRSPCRPLPWVPGCPGHSTVITGVNQNVLVGSAACPPSLLVLCGQGPGLGPGPAEGPAPRNVPCILTEGTAACPLSPGFLETLRSRDTSQPELPEAIVLPAGRRIGLVGD